jgi:hypothetical protein
MLKSPAISETTAALISILSPPSHTSPGYRT